MARHKQRKGNLTPAQAKAIQQGAQRIAAKHGILINGDKSQTLAKFTNKAKTNRKPAITGQNN